MNYLLKKKNDVYFREHENMELENTRITDIKIFDNSTQLDATICYDKPCPGLMLQTPKGCYCNCGNDFDLNASGTKCLRQSKPTTKIECKTGKTEFLLILSPHSNMSLIFLH